MSELPDRSQDPRPNTEFSLGLVVNTFNQPDYLSRVLQAISRQTRLPQEILLADDGSENETRQVFESWASRQRFSCAHIWQAREGFRRAGILNRAITKAASEYLVFLDGDTVPHPQFVADHQRLACRKTLIQGHRALVEQRAARFFGLGEFHRDRRRALLSGQLQGLKHAFRWPWPWRRNRNTLRGTRGCNLAIWREDLVRVNGYNEAFVGWGREDSELVARLMNAGVRRLDVRGWALCFHLWHPPASRENLPANDQLLATAIAQKAVWCERGLDRAVH